MGEEVKFVVIDDEGEHKRNPWQKRVAARAKIVAGVRKITDWCRSHKEELIVIVPLALTGATAIVKVVGKRANLAKQEDIKNLYCYDRSLGHYWALRRELSNKEWLEIDRRKKDGERLADILAELKVLK